MERANAHVIPLETCRLGTRVVAKQQDQHSAVAQSKATPESDGRQINISRVHRPRHQCEAARGADRGAAERLQKKAERIALGLRRFESFEVRALALRDTAGGAMRRS